MNTEILTNQATTSLTYANKFALKKRHKTIHSDDLFQGIYHFMKTTDFFEIFCNVLHIKSTEKRESFFDQEDIKLTSKQIINTQHLKFQKNIYAQIKKYVNENDKKIDIITLLYISLSNLST